MYLMNFLFDFDQKNGLFSGDRPATRGISSPELCTSKNWLKLVLKDSNGDPKDLDKFNPETAIWEDRGDMDSSSLLVQNDGKDDKLIGIRVAPDPASPVAVAQDATLTLSVCFGRPTQSSLPRSSPFDGDTTDHAVQTTFIKYEEKPNRVDANGNPVWFFPLAEVNHWPPEHRTHRYEFAVGMKVKSGGVTHDYSHDPEMDIST